MNDEIIRQFKWLIDSPDVHIHDVIKAWDDVFVDGNNIRRFWGKTKEPPHGDWDDYWQKWIEVDVIPLSEGRYPYVWYKMILPSRNHSVFTKRGIIVTMVAKQIYKEGFDPDLLEWEISIQPPIQYNPFVGDKTPYQRPETKVPSYGVIYFIQGVDGGPIKIGYSTDLRTRFATLQIGSPIRLRIIASVPADASLESQLHSRFAHLRLHGEWFEPSTELITYINEIAASGVK